VTVLFSSVAISDLFYNHLSGGIMPNTFTPVGHHLLNAYLAWFAENNISKVHILVDVSKNPSPFIRGLGTHRSRTTMNIGPKAVRSLIIDKDGVSFKAQFGGDEHHVFLLLSEILGLEILVGGQVVLVDLFDFQRIFRQLQATDDIVIPTIDPNAPPKLCVVK
jgi:stringent starvation protein B